MERNLRDEVNAVVKNVGAVATGAEKASGYDVAVLQLSSDIPIDASTIKAASLPALGRAGDVFVNRDAPSTG